MIAPAIESAELDAVAACDIKMNAAARAALRASNYSPLRKLDCRVLDGVVEISGAVPSFYLKQMAQVAMLRLHGCTTVRNLIEVTDENSVAMATSCVPQPSN